MGNKRRVKFWKDKWCGNEPLCVSFLSLFALASSKEVWVADSQNQSNIRGCRTTNFSRHLNDWEIVECFFSRLQERVVNENGRR